MRPPTDRPELLRAGYAICAVGRSGSSWFAKLLGSTGELGRPADFFNTPYQRRLFGGGYPAQPRRQVDLVLSEGATPNGLYGLKVFPRHLDAVMRQLDLGRELPSLRFIHWTRRDTLGQALSFHRALQNLQWRSTQASRIDAVYDGQGIYDALVRVVRQNARWELFFGRTGIAPLRLVYEDALADPQAAVDAVAAFLATESRPRITADGMDLDIQRDDTTERWRERFLAEFASFGAVDTL